MVRGFESREIAPAPCSLRSIRGRFGRRGKMDTTSQEATGFRIARNTGGRFVCRESGSARWRRAARLYEKGRAVRAKSFARRRSCRGMIPWNVFAIRGVEFGGIHPDSMSWPKPDEGLCVIFVFTAKPNPDEESRPVLRNRSSWKRIMADSAKEATTRIRYTRHRGSSERRAMKRCGEGSGFRRIRFGNTSW